MGYGVPIASERIEPTEFSRDSVKATASQFLGFFADAYDLTLVLSASIILSTVFLPPEVPDLIKAFEIIFSYSLTIIARPLGSAFFGNLGDKIGRRKILLITVYSDFFFAGGIAILPSYNQAGYLGFILYSIIRFGLGFFLGGEYSAGHPYVMEWTPSRYRGIISGLVQGGFSLGAAMSGGIVAIFLYFYGFAGVTQFAWRYMILTIFIPLIPALFIRLKIRESPVFEDVKSKERIETMPIAALFKKPVIYDFLQIMLVMTGLFFFSYVLFAYVPVIIASEPSSLTESFASDVIVIASLGAFTGALFFGSISQKIGRRRTGLIISVAAFALAVPLYYLLISYSASSMLPWVLAIAVLIGFITQGPWGLVPVYLAERFSATHRASGSGFGYSSGIFIGGWFSIYIPLMHTYLFGRIDSPTNVWFSTAVLLMIGALLTGIGFYKGPETVGANLSNS